MYLGSNVVLIGPYPCIISTHMSNSESLSCMTTPGDLGDYQVSVIVDGTDVVSQCCHTYSDDRTPSECLDLDPGLPLKES
jgi:hypothetical protein